MIFRLRSDVHAPWTAGGSCDNRELAALNGPRFTAFLHRLEDELPAEFESTDGGTYQGIYRHGFRDDYP